MAPRTKAREDPEEPPRRSQRLAISSSMATANGVSKPSRAPRKRNDHSPLRNDRHLVIPEDELRDAIRTPPTHRDRDEHLWEEDLDNDNYNRAFSQGDALDAPSDTQAFSQGVSSQRLSSQFDEVYEKEEDVWGYLYPYYNYHGGSRIALRRNMPKPSQADRALGFTVRSANKITPGRFTIGRRKQDVDLVIDNPALSNCHCMLYVVNGDLGEVILEDLSTNGTFVRDQIVGRNQRRVLHDGDTIDLCRQACFTFRLPRYRQTASRFRRQYEVLECLGQGQYGQVYRAIEKSSGIHYAVKMFNLDPGDSRKLETLRQEQSMLLAVDHPNCLTMKDIFHEREGVYMVLEYAGGELFDLIRTKQKLSENEARIVFKQIFDGIKHLHDRNMVHRDLKPENILLPDTNIHRVKICDFGLAKIIGEDSFTTTLCGTPAYVAPEVLVRNREYNKAVDIWSLGVILFITLCGYPPFSDELYNPTNFPYNMTQQIMRGIFYFESPYWDPVSNEACSLIEAMLQVNPDKRLTIDECLAHPWMSSVINPADSTGLAGPMANLEFKRRSITRTRTLLSDQLAQVIGVGASIAPPRQVGAGRLRQEARPADSRRPEDFVAIGDRGDPALYDRHNGPREQTHDIASSQKQRERRRERASNRDREREHREREVDSIREPERERRTAGRRERDRDVWRERERDRDRDSDRRRRK